MALQKTIKNDAGVDVSYWRVYRLNINFDGHTEVILVGYLAEDERRDNKSWVEAKTFSFAEVFETRAEAYTNIKKSNIITDPETQEETETNPFADALDV